MSSNDMNVVKGKRTYMIHGEPKSMSYQGQLEYLDRITNKYAELIAVEEEMKETKNRQEQVKTRA